MPTSNHSLTLERGLRVLRALAEHPDGLTVSELAADLGTHRAGIYRLVRPLLNEGLVVRGPDGRHALGLGLIELASHVRPRLREVAVAELQRLADDLGATTALTVRDGDEAVVLAVVEPRHTTMHIAYRAGLRHRVDVAASGLAILAGAPHQRGERKAVTIARRVGFARSVAELLPGVSGVGAPILSRRGDAQAAISAVWIEPRDDRAAGRRVIRSAQSIADALG